MASAYLRVLFRNGRTVLAAAFMGGCFINASAQAGELNARMMADTCAPCHGTGGNSLGSTPTLASLPAAHIMQAFKEFAAGTRPATMMSRIAKGYSEAEISAIAHYFEMQQVVSMPTESAPKKAK